MAIKRGFLRLAGTFLIAGAGLLVVGGLVVAVKTGEPQLILLALPIVPLWLTAGLLMTTSLVSEACWDEESLCLALAYETRVLTWSEILQARAVTVRVWPMPGEAVLILLKYTRPVSGRAKSAWALLALPSERLSSWPSAHIGLSLPRRDPERN